MKLNYRVKNLPAANPAHLPVLLIHGLFGSLDNLGILARSLQEHYPVIQIDLRNHGLSPHSAEMNYPLMAEDLLALLDELQLEKVILIGHSMGAKAAMTLTALVPERISKLVSIDMAPVAYQVRRHEEIFQALQAVTDAGITQRSVAAQLMREHLPEEGVIQFLLKSFHEGQWRFNLPVLMAQYDTLIGWQPTPPWPHPALFICGGLSDYVQAAHRSELLAQFPQAKAHVVAGTGHWVHAEKPEAVLRAIYRYLDEA